MRTQLAHKRGRLPRYIKRVSKKVGMSPGTLMHVGEPKDESVIVSLIYYDESRCEEVAVATGDQALISRERTGVSWINIDGTHDLTIVERIGAHYGLHPLILEDIVTTGQRPKFEDFGEYIFITLVALEGTGSGGEVISDQISMVFGANYLLSFQARPGDCWGPVRERLRQGKGRLRKTGADYLAYSLMDAVVDNYFVTLERIGEQIEQLQDQVLTDPTPEVLAEIHSVKGDLLYLRKSVWPLRDVISSMQRTESSLISDLTTTYLRDIHDHTVQVMDTIETLRDIVSGLLDIYLSSVSNRLNAVMKVLTIIATIFIPLTFIAGVYGMNFDVMPELRWRWGYPAIMGIMFALGVTMLAWFRKKDWL